MNTNAQTSNQSNDSNPTIGSRVTWGSQSQGHWNNYTGTVVALVQKGEYADDVISRFINSKENESKKFTVVSGKKGGPRKSLGYVVKLDPLPGTRGNARLFVPRAVSLA